MNSFQALGAMTLGAAAVIGPCNTAIADVEQRWVDRFNGPANMNDFGEDITVDQNGDIYMAGFTFVQVQQNLFSPQYLLVKYDRDGNRLWTRQYANGTASAAGYEVVVDPNNNVIIAGSINLGDDWAERKYDSTGNLLWTAVYEANSIPLTHPTDLVVDNAGNTMMTGFVRADGGPGHAPVVKFNANGVQQWRRRYVGPELESAAGAALAVDGAGNIYWTGSVVIPGVASEVGVAKFGPDGTILWEQTFGSPGPVTADRGEDIKLDSAGNVIVTGWVGGNSTDRRDVVVLKYDAQGTLLWSRTFGQIQRDDAGVKAAIDGQNNIIVVGYTENDGRNLDALVVKYDAAGNLLWDFAHGATGRDHDFATDVALDGQGNIYATGSHRPFTGIDHYLTLSLDPAGNQRWLQEYAGPADGGSVAFAIAVDGSDAYVTGESPGINTRFDIATIRYAQPSQGGAAELVDFRILDGTLVSGGLPELATSDDAYLETEARVTGEVAQPHLMRMRIGATTTVQNPSTIDLTLESHITDVEATVWLTMRNWDTRRWEQVDQFAVGMQDEIHQVTIPNAGRFVRASDGRIVLRIKKIVFFPFTLGGFHSLIDQVEIVVR